MSAILLFWVIAILILFIYAILIYIIGQGWNSILDFNSAPGKPDVFVSVIIAVRNEESNILSVLDDISEQDYSPETFEVLIVDDHSQDQTAKLVNRKIAARKNMHLLSLPEGKSGKKSAIASGIGQARGELIVTVDADCHIQNRWLSTIATYYEKQGKPDMIIGLVDYFPPDSCTGKLQQFEFLSLIGSGAGAAGAGHPLMCNGANLAYKKESYLLFSDPMTSIVASGDDVFLMLKFKQKGYTIRVLKSTDSIVYTQSPSSMKIFLNQRMRWISKARHYKDPDVIITALVIFITNISLLFSMGVLIAGINCILFPILFILKSLIDFLFMKQILDFFNQKQLLKFLIIIQLLYPFYMLSTGIAGNLFRAAWKGRFIKS